jgi:hypothetical protein
MKETNKLNRGSRQGIKKIHKIMRTSKYFATDDSKMENETFLGFPSIDTSDGGSMKFRIAKIASTFTEEALDIGGTPEIKQKINSEQNFVNFSDLESVLKRISNTSTMNKTSHITQTLKDKTE